MWDLKPQPRNERKQNPFSAPPPASQIPSIAAGTEQNLGIPFAQSGGGTAAAAATLMSQWADGPIGRSPASFRACSPQTATTANLAAQTPPGLWGSLQAAGSAVANATLGAYHTVSDFATRASQQVANAEHYVEHGVDQSEDRFTHKAESVASAARGIPVLEPMANAGAWLSTQSAQLTGGVLKGATGLLGGIGNMVLHPIDTAVGVSKMVEHSPGILSTPVRLLHGLSDAAIGEKGMLDGLAYGLNPLHFAAEDAQYWQQFGGAIVAPYKQSIQQGKPAEALGRGIFDIGSLFLGPGEAKAASKGGEAASLGAKAERIGAASHADAAIKPIEAAANGAGKAERTAEYMKKRMHETIKSLWARPLPPEVRAELQTRWQQIEASAKELSVSSGDPAMMAAKERLDALRMQSSDTVKGYHGGIVGSTTEQVAKLAQDNWRRTDAHVRAMVNAGAPLTLESIQEINRLLGEGLEHNKGVPGQLRELDMDVSANRDWSRVYLPASEVRTAMDEFLSWHQESAGRIPPIEQAAHAYQRLSSIHPFMDGNGRTGRMVMDYVLQSHGLPPAALVGPELNTAIFSIQALFGASPLPAEHAALSVTQGIERTLGLLQEAQPPQSPRFIRPQMSIRVPMLRTIDANRQQSTEKDVALSH